MYFLISIKVLALEQNSFYKDKMVNTYIWRRHCKLIFVCTTSIIT